MGRVQQERKTEMERTAASRPSPAIIVAVLALVAALAGTAVAERATTSAKPVTKKKAKKITRKQINRLAPGLSVASADTATNAENADALGGQGPAAFRTASAADERGNTVPLTDQFSTVLSTTITIPSAKTITAVASIEAVSDGTNNEVISCNLNIAGTDGVRQSTDINGGISDHTTLPLTQVRSLGAGTHTVLAECFRNVAGTVSVDERVLSVVATG
jgi:hypothetical protein